MQISIVDQSGATARVILAGRCDVAGAEVMALPLATLAASKRAVVVDMSGVTILTSTCTRHLVSAGKALAHRGGGLVLLNPSDNVADVLATLGASTMLDIVRSEGEAEAALKRHAGA
jgi:anti-anti-sigma factor